MTVSSSPVPQSNKPIIAGTPPARTVVQMMAYSAEEYLEQEVSDLETIRQTMGKWPVTWINVDGPIQPDLVEGIGRIFDLHRLPLEDVVTGNQRAKIEPYRDHLFVVLRMPVAGERLETEQLSLFLGPKCVLTFQEILGDSFNGVRERIRRGGGRIRTVGPDYLAYALLDAVIDSYYPVMEDYGERFEELEERIIEQPQYSVLTEIHQLKRDLLTLRRAVWPAREVFGSLIRDPMALITDDTRVYLRDCYDHTVEIIDLVETVRELCSDLVDVYISSTGNRLNEIMKVLTIISTIFIPLGFVASIYGMNFNTEKSPWNMPELNWIFGYPFALALMALIACGLLWYIWHKGWFRSMEPDRREKTDDHIERLSRE